MNINKKKVYRVGLIIYSEKELQDIITSAKKDSRTKEIVYIKHDKDIDKNGELKKEHYHLLFNFSRGPITLRTVKRNILGVEEDRYVKILSKSWQKNLQYLIHKNNNDKYKYSLDDVVIVRGNREEINKLIISDGPINKSRYLNELKDLIMSREIRNENQAENWTVENFGSAELYLDYFRKISNYLKAIKESDKFKDLNKQLYGVVFIQGPSEVGKSSYAKQLCSDFNERFNYSGIFQGSAGSSDPLDGYSNQNTLILNEARAENMEKIGVSNILELIDWHNGTSIHSRFKNVEIDNIKLIIFTSVNSLEKVFEVFDDEEQKQFLRRLKTKIIMDNETIDVFNYCENDGTYKKYKSFENTYNRYYMEQKYGKPKNLVLDLI